MNFIPCTKEVMEIYTNETNNLIDLRETGDAFSGYIEGVGVFTVTEKDFIELLVQNFIGSHTIIVCDFSKLEFFEITA
jgi:hypothetical protein